MGHVLVAGAGNGGFAVAADLAQRGVRVRLWNRSPAALEPVRLAGGLHYQGVLGEGFAPVEAVGTDASRLLPEAEAVVVALPATAHAEVAAHIAPHLPDGVPVLLNPGGLFGSLDFATALRAAGYTGRLRIAETGTLTHICRKMGESGVHITSRLQRLPFAALPARDTAELQELLRPHFPELHAVADVLLTGLSNVNAVLHPPGMLLAAAWIERTQGDLFYYYDLATPAVARLMAAIDEERLLVGKAYGYALQPFLDYFAEIGSTSQEAASAKDYVRALRDSQPNRFIKAPVSLQHRYLEEDIPMGLVPLGDLGRAAGVQTPTIDAIIALAGLIAARDFRSAGRTLARLGLGGLSAVELRRRVEEEAA